MAQIYHANLDNLKEAYAKEMMVLKKRVTELEEIEKKVRTKKEKLKEKVSMLQANMKSEQELHDAALSDAQKRETDLKSEVFSLKTEATNQYLEGFEKALAQAQFLYPCLDFTRWDPSKL